MKLFKLKITIQLVYVYPFSFLNDWKYNIKIYLTYLKAKRKFRKLNWSENDIFKLTMCCDCFNDAVDTLGYAITENTLVILKLRPLILEGYERSWE